MTVRADSARTRAFALGLVALVTVLTLAAQVLAYDGQNPNVVEMDASPNNARCDQQVEVHVIVHDAESGALVTDTFVNWDFKKKGAPGDSVSPGRTVTDAFGKSSATVSFGNAEGRRTVRVTIARWPSTLAISCAGGVTQPTPAPTPKPTQKPPSASTPSPAPSDGPPASLPSSPATTATTATAEPPATPEATQLAVSTSLPTTANEIATDPPSTTGAIPTSSAGSSAPSTVGAPTTTGPTPSMGLATFGLIGLVGLVVGGVTFFFLRRR